MVARFAGASLGLLAFAVCTAAGLFAQNPPSVTLSRSILAMFVFCALGLLLGAVAQMVIAEHEGTQEAKIQSKYQDNTTDTADTGDEGGRERSSTGGSAENEGGSIAT